MDRLNECIVSNLKVLQKQNPPSERTEFTFNSAEFHAVLTVLKHNFVCFEMQKRHSIDIDVEIIDKLIQHLNLLCFKTLNLTVMGNTISKEIKKATISILKQTLSITTSDGIGNFIKTASEFEKFDNNNVAWVAKLVLGEQCVMEDALREFEEFEWVETLPFDKDYLVASKKLIKTFILCLGKLNMILARPSKTIEFVDYSERVLACVRNLTALVDDFVFCFDQEIELDQLYPIIDELKGSGQEIISLINEQELDSKGIKWIELCKSQFTKGYLKLIPESVLKDL